MSASDPALPALAFAAALAASAQTLAQTPSVVTDADIERVRREQTTISDQDIEQARQRHRVPDEADLEAAPAQPNLDALPTPAVRAPIDVEALARGYASQTQAMSLAEGLASGPGLLVFVSLSMPQPTLQRLIDQAARAQASIVLRGFADGSLRTTVAQVQRLIGDRQVAVQIDPRAFDRYAVTRVPAFVLVRDGARPLACAGGSCAPAQGFLRTSGDVSLDYALEHMQRSAPGFGPAADIFLKRIRG